MALALTIERAALLPALAAILKAVETRTSVPILSHLLLRASGGHLTVTGTDLDIQVTATLPANVEAPGAITVPAQAFRDLVRKAPEKGTLRVAEAATRGAATLSAGRARATVPTLPVEDFPDLTFVAQANFAHGFALSGDDLATTINACDFAISTEETRYYLNGIYCHIVEAEDGPALRFVATDGYRLARIGRSAPAGLVGETAGVIIPRKTVGLIKDLADAAGTGEIRLDLSDRAVRAAAGDLAVTSKLIDGTFPDYQRVIPYGGDREARVPAKALSRILEFCATLNTDKTPIVKLEFADSLLTVSLRNKEGGEVRDELEIEFAGAPFDLGVNARYLTEILERAGGDTVRMRLGPEPGSPALIGNSLDERLFVLMPMRI